MMKVDILSQVLSLKCVIRKRFEKLEWLDLPNGPNGIYFFVKGVWSASDYAIFMLEKNFTVFVWKFLYIVSTILQRILEFDVPRATIIKRGPS